MTTNPTEVQGAWTRGWTLDRHITSSVFPRLHEFGHARFDSTRSPIGEWLYQLKYRGQDTVDQVADVMAKKFITVRTSDDAEALSRQTETGVTGSEDLFSDTAVAP